MSKPTTFIEPASFGSHTECSVAVKPTGAFYVFANIKHLTMDSHKFALDLLEQTDVGVTPGIDFGSGGEGYVRFSYATSVEKIREGLERIAAYLG